MKLYHLDRNGTVDIQNGVTLQPLNTLAKDVFESRFVSEFANGISFHGINYLDNTRRNLAACISERQYSVPTSAGQQIWNIGKLCIEYESLASEKRFIDSQMIEYNCEIVRRAYFPQYVSRFQCLFAVNDVSEFSLWPELEQTSGKSHILELELNSEIPRFDSNWLKGGLILSGNLECSYIGYLPAASFDAAYNYWSGNPTDDPRWEYLIPLPIDGKNIRLLNEQDTKL